MISPQYEWRNGKRVELKQWMNGVVAPDDAGEMTFFGGLTADPSYSSYVDARELHALLALYFKDQPLTAEEMATAQERMNG